MKTKSISLSLPLPPSPTPLSFNSKEAAKVVNVELIFILDAIF